MKAVTDANIIIAMLIKPGKPIELFFKHELELYAPELLFVELERNKQHILRKTKIEQHEFERFFSLLKRNITIVPEQTFLKYRKRAERICPDQKDITYFALALHLKCPVWSNEKRLKEQKVITVYSTHELLALFNMG